jgi:hypothetical protein
MSRRTPQFARDTDLRRVYPADGLTADQRKQVKRDMKALGEPQRKVESKPGVRVLRRVQLQRADGTTFWTETTEPLEDLRNHGYPVLAVKMSEWGKSPAPKPPRWLVPGIAWVLRLGGLGGVVAASTLDPGNPALFVLAAGLMMVGAALTAPDG